MAEIAAKSRKLDENCPIHELPDEIIESIFCLVGTNFGKPKPADDDWLTETPETNPIDTPKDKFRLFLVSHRFKRLAEDPRSWRRNTTLYLYPKFNGFNPSGPNGLRINRQPFNDRKASVALATFLNIAPIKNLLFFDITNFTMGKYNAIMRKNIFSELVSQEEKLGNSVQSLSILGDVIHDDARDIMSWACRTMVNIHSLYITFPVHAGMMDFSKCESFQSELLESITDRPLYRVTLRHFTETEKLIPVLSGKHIQELNIDTDTCDPIETDHFIKIFNSLPDECFVKLVLDSVTSYYIADLDINRWINSCRPETLKNIGHLELNHCCDFPFNLHQSLPLLPSLYHLKIYGDESINTDDEVLQIFISITNLVNLYATRRPNLNIYLKASVGQGLFSRNHLEQIQTQSPNQWEGIEIEELAADEQWKLRYSFKKGYTSVDFVIELQDG